MENPAPQLIPGGRTPWLAPRLWVGYLLAGVVVGLLWVVQTGPLWEHGLRMAVVLLVVPTAVHLIRRRWAAGKPATVHRISLPRIAVAKAVLVIAALTVTWLFEPSLPRIHYLGGLALTVTIAAGGPLLHRHLLTAPSVPE
ncbi:hypothetical protein [Nocardia sp. NPDC046763]|uniref:hypothetical protein n=1 Tax=Nocardia sp. NPDC046763 TaxID=3155256 RepID=UPI0033F0C5BB